MESIPRRYQQASGPKMMPEITMVIGTATFFSGGKNSRVLGEAILCAIAEMVKAT